MNGQQSQDFINKFMNGTLTEKEMNKLSDMTEDEWNQVLEMRDNLLDVNQSIMETFQEVADAIGNAFSGYVEDMDRGIGRIDKAKEAVQSYKNIIDIVGQDFLGISNDLMRELDQDTVNIANQKVEATRAKLQSL